MLEADPPLAIFDGLDFIFEQAFFLTSKKFQKDYEHGKLFLYSYRGSPDTYATYRRELERLLQWSTHIRACCLSELSFHDIEDFIEFCQSPPKNWIATQQAPRFLDKDGRRCPNADWRPFLAKISKAAHKNHLSPSSKRYSLSPSAIQVMFATLSSFFNYLVQHNYIAHNPVSQIRQKNRFFQLSQLTSRPVRKLTELQWYYVIETAEQAADADPVYERTLFIMNIMYGLYLRVSELVSTKRWSPLQSHFHKDYSGNWWFMTVGKGNKQREIAVSDDVLSALKRYRASLGLTVLPTIAEQTPLILKTKGFGGIDSTRQIRNIVQQCFDAAYERLQVEGFEEESLNLQAATVHWLRHTGISDDVKNRPREHVRDDAGHASSAITDRYIDVALQERHQSARRKLVKPE